MHRSHEEDGVTEHSSNQVGPGLGSLNTGLGCIAGQSVSVQQEACREAPVLSRCPEFLKGHNC